MFEQLMAIINKATAEQYTKHIYPLIKAWEDKGIYIDSLNNEQFEMCKSELLNAINY